LLLVVAVATGCTSHQSVRLSGSPQFVAAELSAPSRENQTVGIVQVTLDDGSQIDFAEPVSLDANGILRGVEVTESTGERTVTRTVEVPWTRVANAVIEETRSRTDWEKTASTVLGVAAATVLGFVLLWEASCSDDDWFC